MVYLDAKTDTYLEEVSSCNIFVVKGKTIRTPPLKVRGMLGSAVLLGVRVKVWARARARQPTPCRCRCHAPPPTQLPTQTQTLLGHYPAWRDAAQHH